MSYTLQYFAFCAAIFECFFLNANFSLVTIKHLVSLEKLKPEKTQKRFAVLFCLETQ